MYIYKHLETVTQGCWVKNSKAPMPFGKGSFNTKRKITTIKTSIKNHRIFQNVPET